MSYQTRLSFCLFALAVVLLFNAQILPGQQDSKSSAIEHLISLGAVLTTDDAGKVVALQFPEGVGFNEQSWHNLGELTDLRDLDLGALGIGNEMLRHVAKLKELRSLNLFGNLLDSNSLVYIEGLQNLETLYLYRTFITDEGIESIVKLKNLRRLNMFDTILTDKGLDQLGQFSSLRYLSIGNSMARQGQTQTFPRSSFSQTGIERLRQALPETEITYWGAAGRLDVPRLIQRTQKKNGDTWPNLLTTKVVEAPDLSKRTKGSDWPFFLGPKRNGKSIETGIRADWKTSPPKLLWHKKVGTGYAAPAVAKGRLLFYHRVRNNGGRERFKERLTCFQSETGKELWHADFPTDYNDLNGYGDGPRSSPVVDEDRVYLLSPSGILRCLQLVDGKSVWAVDLVESFDCELPTYGMGASPVVYQNTLLVVVGSKSDDLAQKNSTVVAFDKSTGVFRYGVGKHLASYATPVIQNSQGRPWCFAFTQNGLLSFNPATGDSDFDFPWAANIAGCANAASPVVHDSQVFFSESYKLGGAMLRFAFEKPSSPAIVWMDSRQVREKSMASHWNTPILHEGFLYGCSGRHRSDGTIKCVEWSTGRTRWQMKLGGRSSLTYIDNHFLNLTETGLLTLFRATPTGYVEAGRLDKTNTSVVPAYPAWTAPVVARGLLYLRGKHELICYDLNSD